MNGKTSPTFSLQLVHCNVNGICNKIQIIGDTLVNSFQPGVLLITESHLTPSISNATISIPGYEVLRNDSGSSSKHGVCAFVKDTLRFDEVDVSHTNCLSFRLTKLNIYVYVVYRPPSNSSEQNQALIDFLVDSCAEKEVVILGDFNLPSVTWKDQRPCGSPSLTEEKFLDAFSSLGLTQWISECTFPRSGNVLDLILTSEQDRIGTVQVQPPPPGCDHCSIHCEYLFDVEVQQSSQQRLQILWHHGHYGHINNILSDIDWDFELAYMTAEEAFSRLLSILEPLIDQYVPRASHDRHNKVPWKTNAPSSLKRRRRAAWENYKNLRSSLGRKTPSVISALTAFQEINNQLRSFAATSQIEYEKSLIERSKDNPKLLYSYIRHKKQFRSSIGPLRLNSGMISDDPKEMADCLLKTFCDIHAATIPANPVQHQRCEDTIEDINFGPADVYATLSKLDPNSAMGQDGLHPQLLKSCAASLTIPLYKIYLQSLKEKKLPMVWKSSVIIPIFKKGSRHDPMNYRPVSLTSVCCKNFERIIAKGLHSFLSENQILTDEQFGFRPGRSTEDQLLLTYDEVTTGMDSGFPVDLIMFDFSKAFDVVCHALLLEKLRLLGVQGQLLGWLRDFLVDRTMQVLVKNTTSDSEVVRSGVPQGSVLGPILFLLYINHIASNLTCSYNIFADDLKIFMKLEKESPLASAKQLQDDINSLHHTAVSWGLSMNFKKCAVLSFRRRFHHDIPVAYTLNNNEIPCAYSYSDLGVIVDTDLKFHEHCCSAATKAGGIAHNFLKSTKCRSSEFMTHILKTHIRPVLEYASPVWNSGYVQDVKRLEAVQRLWTRNILGLRDKEYGDRLRKLDLFSVKGRLLRADIIKCWKIFHGHCHLSPEMLWNLQVDNRTRGHLYKIRVCRCQVDARARFFSHRVVQHWNGLPEWLVRETSLPQFKKGLAATLGDRLYEYLK